MIELTKKNAAGFVFGKILKGFSFPKKIKVGEILGFALSQIKSLDGGFQKAGFFAQVRTVKRVVRITRSNLTGVRWNPSDRGFFDHLRVVGVNVAEKHGSQFFVG